MWRRITLSFEIRGEQKKLVGSAPYFAFLASKNPKYNGHFKNYGIWKKTLSVLPRTAEMTHIRNSFLL